MEYKENIMYQRWLTKAGEYNHCLPTHEKCHVSMY